MLINKENLVNEFNNEVDNYMSSVRPDEKTKKEF